MMQASGALEKLRTLPTCALFRSQVALCHLHCHPLRFTLY